VSKRSPLLAALDAATGKAEQVAGGNVVRLPGPAQAPVQPDLDADVLAGLDELMAMAQQPSPGTGTVAPSVADESPPSPATPVTSAGAALTGPMSATDGIRKVNDSHFVAPLAGESTIWHEGIDPEVGRHAVVPVSTNSVRLKFAPQSAAVPVPGIVGGTRLVPIFDLWMKSPHRREYAGGVVFQPEGGTSADVYNTWHGFSVAPKAGDASPMLDHVRMLCGGNLGLAEYVLNWLGFIVQRPGTRPEVALVLRGGQGTGKGTIFRIMLAIFGPHGLHITQPKHLTGNFNSHLRTTRFLFVDEGFWAGDKAGEGVLKGLITEPTIAIEMKGRDVFAAQNRLALGMAANGTWVVPAGADERRYCVVDVPRTKAQDHSYFGPLHAWIDGTGAGIFLGHLLGRDLSGFNVRAAPKNAALDRQKIEAMPALDRWLLEALDTETGPSGEDWTEQAHRVLCDMAGPRFETYCRRTAVRGVRADSRAIGRRLHEVFGCGPATMNRIAGATRRGWTLPGLTQAREMAASEFGLTHYVWGQA
jgi:hypothetical protein